MSQAPSLSAAENGPDDDVPGERDRGDVRDVSDGVCFRIDLGHRPAIGVVDPDRPSGDGCLERLLSDVDHSGDLVALRVDADQRVRPHDRRGMRAGASAYDQRRDHGAARHRSCRDAEVDGASSFS